MASNHSNNYLSLQRKLLRFTGVSLNEKERRWYGLYSVAALISLLSYPVTIIHAVLTNNYPLDVVLESIAYGLACANAFFKILVIYRVRKQIGQALLTLQGDTFAPNTERGGETEKKLIDECTFYVNGQLMVILLMGIGSVGTSTVGSLISRLFHKDPQKWNLPYGQFALFDTTSSPNFELAVAYQAFMIMLMTIAISNVTTFIAGVMAYVAYEYKILQNFILNSVAYSCRKMKQDEDQSSNNAAVYSSDINSIYLLQTLREIVEYHTNLIDLAAEFERLLNVAALVDYIGLSIVICLAMFSIMVLPSLNFRFLDQVLSAAGNVFLQFITAYWGNQVITESGGVIKACYKADFVGTDVRFQKSLISVMQRSQKAVEFTVGKFAPLSINTFQTVIQKAYSYFMVLRRFNE